MSRTPLHLFQGFGVELEYMIVDSKTLSVLPVTDKVIYEIAKEYVNDVEMGETEWSNELALHVIEIKTNGPVSSLNALPELFHRDVKHINSILEKLGGKLMPGAMHPWMDPHKEVKLWPHEYSPIYEAYNRIFDCRGHGWSNLQSMHINLPFADDEEFGMLHAAIRLILPVLPGIAASSPVADSDISPYRDLRLEVYRMNQVKVPSIAGTVIPEAVFSKKDYEHKILHKMYADIAPLDPEGTLQDEWLNSRGAIARFDRNTIEIRLIDIQECPAADLAIAALVTETARALTNEKWSSYKEQTSFHEHDLFKIFQDNVRTAEDTLITNTAYLRMFGMERTECTARELWQHLLDELMSANTQWIEALTVIIAQGTLSSRILKALGGDTSQKNLEKVYGKLCDCLAENKMFLP